MFFIARATAPILPGWLVLTSTILMLVFMGRHSSRFLATPIKKVKPLTQKTVLWYP